MIYCKATMSDLDTIMQIIGAAIKEMEKNNIYQWDTKYPAREDFEKDLADDTLNIGVENDMIAVVYVVNQICDEEYSLAHWKAPNSNYRIIHRLCVNPSCQNHGIARQTLMHIEAEQQILGIQSIRLDVFSCNPYALRLYEHAGYEHTGYADWRMGRFYLMEKILEK